MPKVVKYFLIGLGGLAAILAAIVAIVAINFNPNDYKPLIIKLVQEKKQRTLMIPGEIKLSFFPKIGADLGKISLSERNGTSEFASINSAKVSLAFIPLLSKNVVVDRIVIDGLSTSILRNKDGSTNMDDLLSNEEDSGEKIKFDIDGVSLTNTNIIFDDQQLNRRFNITNLHLETGKIADGAVSQFEIAADIKNRQPAVNVKLSAKSEFMFNVEQRRYVLKGFETGIKGQIADIPDVQLTLAIPAFNATSKELKMPSMALELALKDKQLDTKLKIAGGFNGDFEESMFTSPQLNLDLSGKQGDRAINGKLTTPVSFNLHKQIIDLSTIAALFSLPNPAGGVLNVKVDGKANIDLRKQNVAAFFKGGLDDSSIEAKFGLAQFSPPIYVFDLAIDHIDADRYIAKSNPDTTKAATTTLKSSEKPIDLSALKHLNATGNIKIGALKIHNVKLSNVLVDMRASGGALDVSSLTANLYNGTTSGTLSAVAAQPPRFTFRQNLQDVSVGALLKDAIGKAPIEGKGKVQMNIQAQGATANQIKKSLSGTARIELVDGAVKGINIAQMMRDAKASINLVKGSDSSKQGTTSPQEKTDFSEMSAGFKIIGGIANNDDLTVKSPLIRLNGTGDINVGEDRLDYLLKASVVPTLQGQGGADLQALKGVTIPIKLYGPFSTINWKIDFASMTGDLVKNKLNEKVNEKKEELKSQLQDQLSDQIRGLFGK